MPGLRAAWKTGTWIPAHVRAHSSVMEFSARVPSCAPECEEPRGCTIEGAPSPSKPVLIPAANPHSGSTLQLGEETPASTRGRHRRFYGPSNRHLELTKRSPCQTRTETFISRENTIPCGIQWRLRRKCSCCYAATLREKGFPIEAAKEFRKMPEPNKRPE